ncbi:hypothetical protein EZV62_026506 [Acer yangbiense]|uniref:non-specific serine/threonine protein kinase n=1 Tax=Acer yangbiense TaxID=1000413 RepID=A0A5C7GSD2_9ROSI|nr:hypothetical protein EZV62_026506 [Acer yangbiense]
MKLGWDLRTGFERFITSWRNTDDPSSGDFSFKLDYHGFPEIFLENKQVKTYRSGPWNGLRFSGVPEMKPQNDMDFDFVVDQEEVYYSFNITTENLFSRLIVNKDGILQRLTWIPSRNIWNPFWYAPKDQCDDYRECGPFGVCDTNASPVCKCMRGFQPQFPQAWSLRDGSGGCVRKTDLVCIKDKFLHLKNMKLPETTSAFVDKNMSFRDCAALCFKNCSCTAYAASNITRTTGCVIWTDNLMDMRQYAEGGQDLYVRLAASDIGDGRHVTALVIGITVGSAVLVLGLVGFFLWKRKVLLSKQRGKIVERRGSHERSQDFLLNEAVISTDIITKTQFISDDKNEALLSSDGRFKLGFFSPGNSVRCYVGIWYRFLEKQVVWVANREIPVKNNSTGIFKIVEDGNLAVFDGTAKNDPLWSTNTAEKPLSGRASIIQPTVLPEMRFGFNLKTGRNQVLTSWKSSDDPATGDFSSWLDLQGTPQFFLYKNSAPYWHGGPWNGCTLSGVPDVATRLKTYEVDYSNESDLFAYSFNNDSGGTYITFPARNGTIPFMLTLDHLGTFQSLIWRDQDSNGTKSWERFWVAPEDNCDQYSRCRESAICNTDNAMQCTCLPGFKPMYPQDWFIRCVEKRKVPDARFSWVYGNVSLKEYEKQCLKNCNCTGYASADIHKIGGGCIAWFGELTDIRKLSDGQDFYLRVNAVELGNCKCAEKHEKHSSKEKDARPDHNRSCCSRSASGSLILLTTIAFGEGKLKAKAWELWRDDKALEIVDSCLAQSCLAREAL